jgi:hypothetical protein
MHSEAFTEMVIVRARAAYGKDQLGVAPPRLSRIVDFGLGIPRSGESEIRNLQSAVAERL